MSYQKNALEYLENAADKFSSKIAFADDTNSYTFSSLLNSSKAIASILIKCGVSLRDRVAVIVDRTAISLAGFFAALYAGGLLYPDRLKNAL